MQTVKGDLHIRGRLAVNLPGHLTSCLPEVGVRSSRLQLTKCTTRIPDWPIYTVSPSSAESNIELQQLTTSTMPASYFFDDNYQVWVKVETEDETNSAWPRRERMESESSPPQPDDDPVRNKRCVILSEEELRVAIDLALMSTQSVLDLNRCLKESILSMGSLAVQIKPRCCCSQPPQQ